MKKTSFLLAFIALSFGSIIAQSCSKTTTQATQKAENTSVAVVKPIENTPKMADKMTETKTGTTTDIAVVDKPVLTEKSVEKSVEMTATIPQNTVETTTKMPETTVKRTDATPVAATKPIETAAQMPVQVPVKTAPQIIDNKAVTPVKPSKSAAFDHTAWNDLLKKHVSATGKVNYKGFKADLELLDAYMRSLNEGAPTENASKEERLAYWINAYNAVTVRLIVTNYPLSSITKLDGGKPWDVKRYSNGGKKLSLNDIENNIIRPMGDARIHFALNCAAKSCPPLLNEAFTSDNVNKLLEQRARQFINSSRTVIEKDEIKVSKIFDWYGKDFGNVVDFVNKYAKTKAAKTAKMTFLEYDWNLND